MWKVRLIFLFILFNLFISFSGANPIAGQYSIPLNSIKFEKLENYSFLPVGWSKKGNIALLVHNREIRPGETGSGIKLLIFNTVTDKEIWVSSLYAVDSISLLSSVWRTNVDLFSEKLSDAGIIPDYSPQYGGTLFSLDNDKYQIQTDEKKQIGIEGISSLSLIINSENRGTKSLYKYYFNQSSSEILAEFRVLGYFRSPWEKRISVVSGETIINSDGLEIVGIRLSGAHLTIGYSRKVTEDNKLIDAVLSGQFYNSRNLLKNGARVNNKVSSGEALILMAARQNNWDIVFLLLDYGATLNVPGKSGRTLLHYAAISGERSVCISLLHRGADRSIKDSNGETAYSLALRNGFDEIAGLLKL